MGCSKKSSASNREAKASPTHSINYETLNQVQGDKIVVTTQSAGERGGLPALHHARFRACR